MKNCLDKKIADFDPDYSPNNEINKIAAVQRNLRYDSQRQVYVDEDGLPIRDKFGQLLG